MSEASALERQMLELINAERAAQGLDPVALELRLNDSAEDHSAWMLEQNVFSHTGDGGSSAGDRIEAAGFVFSGSWRWSENIAWQSERGDPGLQDDVVDLHTALMNSPGHRANILDPNVTVVGIGIELGEFNGYTAVMITQNFARTSAPLQLDDGTSTSSDPDPVPFDDTEPTAGDDVLVLETAGVLDLMAGDDTATGSDGNDTIYGQVGMDSLAGGAGQDSLFGGRDADELIGNSGRDYLSGGGGDDSLRGGAHADTLYGNVGRDRLLGGSGHDRLFGGDQMDVLKGQNGNDTLDGGAANDRLVGGNGNDTFVFATGTDRIIDFGRNGYDDLVDLSEATGIVDYSDLIENHVREQSNGHLQIFDDDGDRLILKNISLADVDASDFLF